MTTPATPRIDFYVLADAEPRARAKFACALAEKAFGLGNRVYLHCGDEAEAAALDTLLWTFRDRAFVPHARDAATADEPVLVGHGAPAHAAREVLINLAPAVPEFFDAFQRVVEVVSDEPATKAAGRERFKRYRAAGFEPETHKIGAEA